MLIECTSCQAKIRVPDTAAGKRVKCPKCATIIKVPIEETKPASEEAIAPAPEPKVPEDSTPQETPEDQPAEEGTFSSKPSSKGSKKPPPIKKSGKRAWEDKDDDNDDEPKSSKKRRDDDDEDDDDDDRKPPKKRRRDRDDDDDDDDDDLDVRNRRRRSAPTNGLAMTSMITGIIGIVMAVPGCCCCGFLHIITLACGVTAVVCGHMSMKSPGSGSQAMTGLICGYIAIALSLIGAVLMILSFFLNFAPMGFQGMNQGFNNPGFNNPPPRFPK